MTYDPKDALRSVRKALKQEDAEPQLPTVSAGGYRVKARPETVCFFLLEWLSGALEKMSDDFQDIPTSATALKTHERPDGGVYIGSFSGTREPSGDDVVVFGDVLMEREEAIRCVHAFRRFHAEQHAGRPVRGRVELN